MGIDGKIHNFVEFLFLFLAMEFLVAFDLVCNAFG